MAHRGQWVGKNRPFCTGRPSKSLEVCKKKMTILALEYAHTISGAHFIFFLLAVLSLLAQSSSPSYTLVQSVRLPHSQPQSLSPIPRQASSLLPLPPLPSSKLVKYTFNAQGRLSAPRPPLSASPLQNVPTSSSKKSTPLDRCSDVLRKYQLSNFWQWVLAQLTTTTKHLVPFPPTRTRYQISCGGNIRSLFRTSSARS